MDADGKQLVFVVKKGSDSSILWKGTVRIVCLKYHPELKTMEDCRLLNLVQFMRVRFRELVIRTYATFEI